VSFALKTSKTSGGLVYSTEGGRMCPQCRNPVDKCTCGKARAVPAGDGIVRVSRETKGRKGKGVTLVRGLVMEETELNQAAKQLKVACGSGGTVKDGVIEIQGDHCDTVIAHLQKAGFVVKRAGG